MSTPAMKQTVQYRYIAPILWMDGYGPKSDKRSLCISLVSSSTPHWQQRWPGPRTQNPARCKNKSHIQISQLSKIPEGVWCWTQNKAVTTKENQTEKKTSWVPQDKNPSVVSRFFFSPHTPNPVDIWIIKYKVSHPAPVVDMLKTEDAITNPKHRK